MQSKAGLSVSQSHYQSNIFTDDSGNTTTTIQQLPLQVSSTRALHTEWSGKFDAKIESNLEFTESQLIGQITNPFPFELKKRPCDVWQLHLRPLQHTWCGFDH